MLEKGNRCYILSQAGTYIRDGFGKFVVVTVTDPHEGILGVQVQRPGRGFVHYAASSLVKVA